MPQLNFWELKSFVVFVAVYWHSSVVDYTERRKTERKKEKCMFSPLHHLTTERRTIKKNFRGGFLNFIKQNYTERRKTERIW